MKLSRARKDSSQQRRFLNGIPAIVANLGKADGESLQAIADSLKSQFQGVIVLAGVIDSDVVLLAAVTSDFTAKVHAGKLIQQIAPVAGGKGGGRAETARGGGKDPSMVDQALAKARTLL